MATVLAISSQVARGHVGLSAIVPGLQALGHDVIALPTILLSNHPGHPHASGQRIDPALLTRMLDALDANGWLASIDAVLTGYLPSPAHVRFTAESIDRVRARNSSAVMICDPVLGDDPKGHYIEPAAAAAIRDELIPRADILRLNRFELAWLSGLDVTSPEMAAAAGRRLPTPTVIATSLPAPGAMLANCVVVRGELVATVTTAVREHVPKGTGDLFAALVTGAIVDGTEAAVATERATRALAAVIADSVGRDELALAAALPALRAAMSGGA